tara:strand:- start:1251 stop:2294 length:1044 start_codon:yes stop_codon:yes gene_type:complete
MLFIDGREISKKKEPFIIAELSANHNGSLNRALRSIQLAKENGAHAIKIQSYTPDTMTIDSKKNDFKIKNGLWKGLSLYELYKKAYTPFEWHADLFAFAKKLGITIFSSPFDESAVDLLEDLSTPAYKIASFEICDLPLISYIAKKKKPILISTGMASMTEIEEAVDTARSSGCEQILLFHCVSAYPTSLDQANLNNIITLKNNFKLEIGLSDHTLGNHAAITAVALGATAIEKHFTLSRKEKGPDSEFSMEPCELKELITSTQQTWKSLGSEGLQRSTSEMKNKIFRRSLYFVKDLKKGETITKYDVKRIRPGYGLHPKYINEVIGKKMLFDVSAGDRVSWELMYT